MSEFSGEAPIRVLEIGYGASPAVKEGTMFKDPCVQYIGVELPVDFEDSYRNEFMPEDFPHLEASVAHLPFRSNVFDYVLMRSIFGQYRFAPETQPSIHLGLHEVARVLTENGQLVIAEENGALPETKVRRELTGAGFVVDSCLYNPLVDWREVPPDDPWLQARSPYYTKKPRLMFPTEDYGHSYLLTSRKREDLITVPAQARIQTDFYKTPDQRSPQAEVLATYEIPLTPAEVV